MNPNDVILLGLNSRVVALHRTDGSILWTQQLDGMLGDGFVTLQSDEQNVYAYAKGHLHCLDLLSGRVLWTNELKGYGYGIGSLCLPGLANTAPEAATYARHQEEERSNNSTNNATT